MSLTKTTMTDEKSQTQPTEQVVVFELDKEEYAVPIGDVQEVVKIPEITPVPNSPEFILGIMNLRGKIVPVLDLEKRFSLVREHEAAPQHIVVTETDDTLFGVRVDKVTEVLRILQEGIKPTPKMVTSKIAADYLKGVVVIEEADEKNQGERILLLLDLTKILSTEELKAVGKMANAQEEEVKENG